jgi:hypothetical protein
VRARFGYLALFASLVLLKHVPARSLSVTQAETFKHLAARQKRAEQIIVEVQRFKVCDQCRSISFKHVATCSVCGAYRFEEDPKIVSVTAREMGANPFPITSGIVPRMET